jgi:hypothetical protein
MPALAATLLLRPLLEPLLFAYYLAPGVAVLAIVAASVTETPKPADLLAPAALILWALETNVGGATWWTVAVLLLLLASRPAFRAWRRATVGDRFGGFGLPPGGLGAARAAESQATTVPG